mgnify:CR=1 FL=1
MTDPAGKQETYQYTPEGLLAAAIGGMHYRYTYDAMGRLTGKQASGRTLLALAYDLNGNLTRQEDLTGKVTEYRYNLLDQVSGGWDSGRQVAGYTYYPDGRVKSLKQVDYPDYREALFYDRAGNRIKRVVKERGEGQREEVSTILMMKRGTC